MTNNTTTRKIAMNWWNNLSFEGKWEQIIKNKSIILGYPDRNPNTLTGREIQQLYNNLK